MLSTILESLRGELARHQAEDERMKALYDEAEKEFTERTRPYFAHASEVRRLSAAIRALEKD